MDGSIAPRLLHWYDAHARVLPWRVTGGARPDPYRVWLSEVMLQQTTTAHAAPYFAMFTERWPTIHALAAAPEADVMAAWAGLGYYARARNLLACARVVAGMGGQFPATEAGLRALPGLGAYTAAAVAAIAFGERAVAIDANVERVVSRLFAIDTPLPAGRKAIDAAAATLVPGDRPGDFTQAMMDLGATICTPRAPKCLVCPVAEPCRARQLGRQDELPVKAARKARPTRTGTAYWIERAGQVWLVTRPATGLLGGMRALPDDGWTARASGTGAAPLPGDWAAGGVVRHGFTHFDLELSVAVRHHAVAPEVAGEWWPIADIAAAGLPTVYAKAARLAMTAEPVRT